MRGDASIGGSVIAAVLSSACCWLPLLLIAFGASAGGVSAFFERWRPWFAGIALLLLAIAFYFVYFRRDACADGSCEKRTTSGVTRQVVLWIATVLVAAFVLFPKYAGGLTRAILGDRAGTASALADGTKTIVHRFDIDGMTCEACAATLEHDLVGLDGVSRAHVDFATRTAEVHAAGESIDAEVARAAERHGWRAKPR